VQQVRINSFDNISIRVVKQSSTPYRRVKEIGGRRRKKRRRGLTNKEELEIDHLEDCQISVGSKYLNVIDCSRCWELVPFEVRRNCNWWWQGHKEGNRHYLECPHLGFGSL
jgi:hypothetical protein